MKPSDLAALIVGLGTFFALMAQASERRAKIGTLPAKDIGGHDASGEPFPARVLSIDHNPESD